MAINNGNLETVRDHAGNLLAIVLYGWRAAPGIRFFTEPDCSMQLGCMLRPAGYRVEAHVHREIPRTVTHTAEVLFVRKGSLRVEFYGAELQDLSSRVLRAGDVVLLLAGGHGLEVIEEAELWEVKQGPYMGKEADKIGLTGAVTTDVAAVSAT